MKKKFLSSLIVGAFVFGVGAANVQPVSADALDKVKDAKETYDKVKDAKEKYDKARDMFGKKIPTVRIDLRRPRMKTVSPCLRPIKILTTTQTLRAAKILSTEPPR